MLPKVSVGRHGGMSIDVGQYRVLVGDEPIDAIQALARDLAGLRICHVNSTATGGGVAELLARHLPFLHAVGLRADWRLLHGEAEFFTVTKAFHNALQGARHDLTAAERELYLRVNEASARLLETEYDVYIVHDPQPAAVRHFAASRGAKWIWRCHIDSSSPEPSVSGFLAPYLQEYDALVYTMPEFVLPELRGQRAAFIAPAIDPLATKNMELPLDVCRRAIADSGIDVARPLLVQVSRFDPWKDPMGVIRAYRLVKEAVPGVQLALIGGMAGDDPEGWKLLEQVEEEAARDPDLFVFTNLAGVGNMEVNVFQRGADVAIQKSLREGFGLVVSEALWKETPVVAGRAGGIPLQFPAGFDRYLIESVEECAARVLDLLRRPGERGAFGRAGREHVRQRFLLPRLIHDEIRLIRELV
ncbi:MAG: glycosyltransferase [Candidatus Rokubacteria bacterium]|nr:glycosyltransferase [Candidatus Rokubacteria bacterium]